MIRRQMLGILLLCLLALAAKAEVIQLDDRSAASREAPTLAWTGQLVASPNGFGIELSLDGFQTVFYSTVEATGQPIEQSEWSMPPMLWSYLPVDSRVSWRVVSLGADGKPADRSRIGELATVGTPSGLNRRALLFTDFSQAAKLEEAEPEDAYLAEEVLAAVPRGLESEFFQSLEDLAFPVETVRTATGRTLVRLQTAPEADVARMVEAGRAKLAEIEKSQSTDARRSDRTVLQPNFIYRPQLEATDPAFADQPRYQYAPQSIRADTAWAAGFTGQDVIVAVLDTGLNTGPSIHQEFDSPGKVLIGPDYANGDDDPADDDSHGTAMSSIIAAEADDAGMVGIAPDARILAVRVLGTSSGTTLDVAQGIDYAVTHGARVINMSIGIKGFGRLPEVRGIDRINVASLRHANDLGVVVVASAGNDHASLPVGLTQHNDVIYVGAVDSTDTLAEYSNLGPWISVVAPGTSVYSASHTDSEGYTSGSGTSQATAVVSGAAALLLSAHPALTPRQVKEILQASAEDLGPPGRDDFYGHGRVDIARALGLAAGSSTVPPDIVSLEAAEEVLVVTFSQDMLADGSANAVDNPTNWLSNLGPFLTSGTPEIAYDAPSRRLTVTNGDVSLISDANVIFVLAANVEGADGVPVLANRTTPSQEGAIRQGIVGQSLLLFNHNASVSDPVAYGSAVATEDGLRVLFRQPVTTMTAEDPANYLLFANPDNREGGEPSGGELVDLSSALFSYDEGSRILTISGFLELAAGETFALSTTAGIRNAVLDNPIHTETLTPSYGVVMASPSDPLELTSVDNSSDGDNFRELISLTFNKSLETGELVFDPANYTVAIGGALVDNPDDMEIFYGVGHNEILLSGFDLSAHDGQSLEVSVSNLRDLDGGPLEDDVVSAEGVVDLEQSNFFPELVSVTAGNDALLARFWYFTKMDEDAVTDPDHWILRSDATDPPTDVVSLGAADFHFDPVDNSLLITNLDLEAGDFFELTATDDIVKRYVDQFPLFDPVFGDIVAGGGEVPPVEPLAASVTSGSVIDGSNADDVQVEVELSAAAFVGQRVRVTLVDSGTPPRTASGTTLLTVDGVQTVDVEELDATAFAVGLVRVQAIVETPGGIKSSVLRGSDAEFQGAMSAISATRTATPTSVSEPGGEVTFGLTVSNDGNTILVLSGLLDNVYGDLNGQGSCALPQALSVGDTYTCGFVETVNGNAGDQQTATVTATANGPDATVSAQASATVTIADVLPTIAVSMTASPSSVEEPGGLVTFTVRVDDAIGAEALTLTTLADSLAGDLDGRGTCEVPVQIAAGSFYQCSFQEAVNGQGGTSVTEVVSATVFDDETNAASGQGSSTITIIENSMSAISVTRTATPTIVPEPGGPVTFGLTVSNDGNTVLALNGLLDNVYGDLNGQGSCALPQTLAVGATYTCGFAATVNGNAGDQQIATVTAMATGPDATVSAQRSATVTISDVLPAITISTTASPSSVEEPGGTVTFTVQVQNVAGAEALTLTALADSLEGDLDGRGTCAVPAQIVAGGAYGCSFQATVNGQAGTSVTQVVSATVLDDEANSASGQGSATVAITNGSSPGAEITVLPPALDFGDHGVDDGPSASQGIRILSVGTSNLTVESSFTGLDADHFQLQNGGIVIDGSGNTLNLGDGSFSAVLTPGSLLQFRVLFDPSSPGAKSANLTLTTNDTDESEVHVVLTGNGSIADFGDAPAPYPTLRADEGARHVLGAGLFLGSGADRDDDGQPSPAADGDDGAGDDEDGVLFTSAVTPGQSATVEIMASGASTLDAWIDFDGDGTWQDSEQVFRNQPLAAGVNGLGFTVPSQSVLGTNFARFRLSSDRGLRPTGTASDGEVEDHRVEITQGATTALDLVHSASQIALAEPGGEVAFTVRVANSGNTAVALSSLVDDVLGDLDGQGSCSLPQTLAVGAVFVCEYVDQIDGIAGDVAARIVSATGSGSAGVASASDSTTIAIRAAGDLPIAIVTHTADPVTVEAPGGPVTFTVRVENVGAEPLTVTNLEDDIHGNIVRPRSGVLYDQTGFASGNGVPDQDFEAVYDGYDAEAADDFEVVWAEGWDIDRVKTVGTSGVSGDATVDVVFYADNDGTPQGGASECVYQGLTPIDLGGSLELQLEPSCHLGPGRHWLAMTVHQDYETNGQHFWGDRTVQVGSPSVWRNPGDAFGRGCVDWTPKTDCNVGNGNSSDLLFQILGQPGGMGEGNPDVATDCTAPRGLAAGEAYECSFVAAVSGDAGEEQVDTVTATVANAASVTSTAQDSATVTITGTPPSTSIFADEFETGNLLAWSASRTDGGDLAATPDAAMNGAWGLDALIDDRQILWVRDDTPDQEHVYRVRFTLDPGALAMADRNSFLIFRAFTAIPSHQELVKIQLLWRDNRGYLLRARVRRDDNSQASTSWTAIDGQPTTVELSWRAASAAGANDGALSFWIDDTLVQELTGIDNDTRLLDSIRLGAVAGVDADTLGHLYFDSFASWRE